MLTKFLARGTGSARAAADYLLGGRDAAGKPREGVEVFRRNPHQVAAVADALAFEHKYTSGVIAWAPEDAPTDDQIGEVLDEFERTAWAGLEPDRYAWAAVLHRERGGGAHVRPGRALRPGDRPEPQHRAARLGEDLRSAARRRQRRTRLEPAQRSGAGQGAATRTPRLHRGGAAAGRARARILPPRPDPRLPAPAFRARHGAEPGRCRRRPAGGGPRSAAPRKGLPDGAGPRDRGPVASERRAVRT